jgi:hypothetical protein
MIWVRVAVSLRLLMQLLMLAFRNIPTGGYGQEPSFKMKKTKKNEKQNLFSTCSCINYSTVTRFFSSARFGHQRLQQDFVFCRSRVQIKSLPNEENQGWWMKVGFWMQPKTYKPTNKLAPTICYIFVGFSTTAPSPEVHVATLPTVAILFT